MAATRLAALLATITTIATAQANPSVTIDLTGVNLSNGRTETRTSAPAAITPSQLYGYQTTAMVRGTPTFSLLWILFPNPTPLSQVLETLAPGSSSQLQGKICNYPPVLPITLSQQVLAGSTTLGTTTVSFSTTLTVGIDAAGVASFTLANISISPSSVGGLLFTSGTTTITSLPPCSGDLNCDGFVDDTDFVLFAVNYDLFSVPPANGVADFNSDGFIDDLDFVIFANSYDQFICP